MRLLQILCITIILTVAWLPRAFARSLECRDLFENSERKETVSQSRINRTETEFEAYLNQAQIPFRKELATNDGALKSFLSHGYLIEAPKRASPEASTRLGQLFARATSFENPGDNARLLIDTLYTEREASAAHYVASAQVITLSPEALLGAADGTRDFFEHELTHHEENIKTKHGEFSLSRFIYRKDGAPVDQTYDFHLSFDELDAYLVSFRFYSGKDGERAQKTREQLEMLIAKERALLARLKAHLENQSPAEKQQLLFGGFKGATVPMNGFYEFGLSPTEHLVLQLSYKQTLPRRPAFNQVRFLIDQTIEEAEWRIEDIELELRK